MSEKYRFILNQRKDGITPFRNCAHPYTDERNLDSLAVIFNFLLFNFSLFYFYIYFY